MITHKTNGIFPNTSREGMENYIDDDVYLLSVRDELQTLSKRKFDKESVLYMIEEWRLGKASTIYEHAIKTGLLVRLAQ